MKVPNRPRAKIYFDVCVHPHKGKASCINTAARNRMGLRTTVLVRNNFDH